MRDRDPHHTWCGTAGASLAHHTAVLRVAYTSGECVGTENAGAELARHQKGLTSASPPCEADRTAARATAIDDALESTNTPRAASPAGERHPREDRVEIQPVASRPNSGRGPDEPRRGSIGVGPTVAGRSACSSRFVRSVENDNDDDQTVVRRPSPTARRPRRHGRTLRGPVAAPESAHRAGGERRSDPDVTPPSAIQASISAGDRAGSWPRGSAAHAERERVPSLMDHVEMARE